MQFVRSLVQRLVLQFESYADKVWYEWILGFLAGADHFVIVIPVDGLVISSTLLVPRKWIRLALFTALGSSLGIYVFAQLVQLWGLAWLQQTFPSFVASHLWAQTESLFQSYGMWIIFLFGLSPISQQPAVALAVLASKSPELIFGVVLAGRILKYSAMCAIARWAPFYIRRIWGIRKELEEVGLDIAKANKNR